MITFIAHLSVPPENDGAIEALLTRVRDITLRKEPGVAWYGFAKSVDVPGSWIVIEVYQDAAAQAAHMATPWVKESIPESIRLTTGMRIEQYVSPGTQPAVRQLKEAQG